MGTNRDRSEPSVARGAGTRGPALHWNHDRSGSPSRRGHSRRRSPPRRQTTPTSTLVDKGPEPKPEEGVPEPCTRVEPTVDERNGPGAGEVGVTSSNLHGGHGPVTRDQGRGPTSSWVSVRTPGVDGECVTRS